MPKQTKQNHQTGSTTLPTSSYGLAQTTTNPGSIGLVIVGLLLFAAGFFLGKLWQENQVLKKSTNAPTAQQPSADSGPTKETLAKAKTPQKDDHFAGAKNPKVVLVEYSDFECPYCNRFHPTTKKILEAYPNDVALVYRHYPLSFHASAQKAAETSECVAKVGGNDAFWKYADYIFGQQESGTQMSSDLIAKSISQSGVDVKAVKACVDSGEMTAKVNAFLAEGQSAGIQGTPGTIVFTKDGAQELIGGALPYDSVKTIVEKYL